MSCLNLSTNVSLNGVDTSSILSEASFTVANILGKLETYVMIVLNESVPAAFGGTEGPAAYGELVSCGGLNSDMNKRLSGAIANILEARLSVPKWRFYLKFYDTTDQQGQKIVWRVKEDIALMSSWCFVSEDQVPGKNKKGDSFWSRVHKQFLKAQMKDPEEICQRNIDSIKGRWKRLSANAHKWIVAYNEAYDRKHSGMSETDIENEAHSIYEVGGYKFNDLVVFNEVMSKHPKWDLSLNRELTRRRAEKEKGKEKEKEVGNEENGGSSKRSKTSKDVDCSIPPIPETSSTGCSTLLRPSSKDEAEKQEKCKASLPSPHSDEAAAEIRALRLSRDNEVEMMSKRIDLDREKIQWKALKMKEKMLNTLLAKDHLSPEDEDLKRRLIAIVFGDRK